MRHSLWVVIISLIIFRFLTTGTEYRQGDRVQITAKVSSEPIRYSNSQRIKAVGLLAQLDKYPEIHYGDRVVVEGIVNEKKLEDATLVRLSESTNILYRLRQKTISFYRESLPEPHASLVAGVTLGSKSNFPQDFWEALKKTGTAHVVVASGMNVTLVAGFLMSLFVTFLDRKKAVPAAFVGIWMYTAISGFDAPLVRAAIMGSLAFSAQAMGRLSQSWRALFLSAGLMLVVKPGWLIDLGFILSFVATASLMLFELKVRRLIHFIPGIFREGLSTSLAAQIGVAPILYLTFGQFYLLSPVVNALVLWTIAPITVLGMIAGIVGLFVPLLGRLILLLVYPLTSWFVWVVGLF